MNCAFCAQARESHARTDALSRIIWPDHPTETVIARLKEVPEELRRICLQVTVHRGAVDEVASLVKALRREIPQPISAAILPPKVEAIAQLLEAGVDVVGLGLDAANEQVYRAVKGSGWKGMLSLIETACRRFPGRIRVHLMVGLGETEEEFCHTMQQVYDWGGGVSLFAFTPVRGTPLEKRLQPPLDSYRRLQVARHLLHHGLAQVRQFHFDQEGRLVNFGRPDLAELLADGEAFRTSGCPDCNRPFYNERPGGTTYNFPRPLNPQEIERALEEMVLPLATSD
jgi:biotin synthase